MYLLENKYINMNEVTLFAKLNGKQHHNNWISTKQKEEEKINISKEERKIWNVIQMLYENIVDTNMRLAPQSMES